MPLRLALPSKGEMEAPTLEYLRGAGLSVDRPNPRQYTAAIPRLPNALVLFQRAADIASKIEEGSADLGITGFDTVSEYCREGDDLVIVLEDLGYSRCELVVAVPDSWIDVQSMADLADLSLEFRERGRDLRVATKYPRLVQNFFYARGLHYFSLVAAQGALEAAPTMGYADLIVDLTSSGTTLRENRLKIVTGGTVVKSQACLIGNARLLRESADKRETTRLMLEFLEARDRAGLHYSLTANIRGASAESVADMLVRRPELAGLKGPTIARVYSKQTGEQDWYAVTIVVRHRNLLQAVEHLRAIGADSVTAAPTSYVFEDVCRSYAALLASLGART